MKKLRVFIVEDEFAVSENLKHFISQVDPNLVDEYVTADNYDMALQILSGTEDFNLSILDVKLPRRKKSFQLIESFPKKKFGQVAFMTTDEPIPPHINNLAQPVLQIIKPLSTEKIAVFVSEVRKQIRGESKNDNTLITHKASKVYRYSVYQNKENYILRDEDILYVESEGNYLKIYTRRQADPFVKIKKAKLEEILKEFNQDIFIRCHESYIININCVASIVKDDKAGGIIKLTVDTRKIEIPFTKDYRKNMIEKGILTGLE